jgi:inhibitor of cysteine peptidase
MPPIYYTNYGQATDGYTQALKKVGQDFSISKWAPQIRESTPTTNPGKFIQSVRSSIASCRDVQILLPDDATLDSIDFLPSFVSLSSIDITHPKSQMKNTLLFGDISQIHMSQKSLYIMSNLNVPTQNSSVLCPPNAKCVAPTLTSASTTLVHKYRLTDTLPEYVYTTSVSGSPMNQYSFDEDEIGNFRLVTSHSAWENEKNVSSTSVTVLDSSGKITGSLHDIAVGENFQSARFIGNRLYLVTFQQIDPLFVIDLGDTVHPKILGELKMPGYSTYLHPYDEYRIIGIGYDTVTNQW